MKEAYEKCVILAIYGHQTLIPQYNCCDYWTKTMLNIWIYHDINNILINSREKTITEISS